ncbi:MAG: helix-turn-helix transcriptional regulator [Terrimonas sp.]|nr:helix-turn-helix transcriptional regulator [Terrimonas sp.]MBN8857085.1 helix-turn-helix transcriptional regulator [Sphingobacteriales bacterium]
MTKDLPLKFKVPKIWEHTLKERTQVPQNQKLVLRFATPYLQTWGAHDENYILQQFFAGAGVAFVLLTICVQHCSLLRVLFDKGNNIIQYTMQGNGFGKLNGHGCLPLLEDTYTLQYVPEGEHRVLFTPGTYHYVYLIPGPLLNALSTDYPNIARLIQSLELSHVDGKVASRLPVNRRVKDLLTRLQNLPEESSEIQLTLTAIVIKLMRQFYRQLGNPESGGQPEDLIAVINTFLANHIQEPVPQLIKKIKKQLFMQSSTLRNHWSHSKGDEHNNTPRTSFKKLRLQYALYLLVIEGLSVTQVAGRLSFKNPYTFSRQFRKYFGVPPTQANSIVEQ